MRPLHLSCALLALAVLAVPAGAGQPKLPTNGGFETQDPNVPGYPLGWFATILPDYADYVTFAHDADVFHSGSRSVRISVHADHPRDEVAYNWGQQFERLRGGKTYRMTAFVRTENVETSPSIFIAFYDVRGNLISGASTETDPRNDVVGTSDWTRVRVTFTVPGATSTAIVRAVLPTNGNRGAQAWFDDVKIKAVQSARAGN